MKLLRWAGWAMVVATIGGSGSALAGCSDDESGASGNDDGKSDSSVNGAPDATANPDSSTPEKDSSTPGDASDAGPAVTEVLGSLGTVTIYPYAAFAEFYQDNTNIHTADSPNCFASTFSEGKRYASVDKVSIGGDFVGDGGFTEPVEVPLTVLPDTGDYAYDYFAPDGQFLYTTPAGGKLVVQIEGKDTLSIPDLAPTALQAPVLADLELTVTDPPAPAGDPPPPVVAQLSKGLTFKWDKTDVGTTVSQRVNVVLRTFRESDPTTNGFATRSGNLYCSFPVADGQGVIPTSLLQAVADDIKAKKLMVTPDVSYGDSKEVVVGNASFYVMTSSVTNLSYLFDVVFDP